MERHKRGVCYAFQKGRCKSGAACRFNYVKSSTNNDNNRSRSNQHADSDNNGGNSASRELERWKQDCTQHQPLGHGLAKFFDRALELVNLDNASRQDVIRSLATDRGLHKIQETIDRDFSLLTDKATQHTFKSQIVPLLRTLSEHHVMTSPLLERHLGSICQFIYGVGGSRGERLFALAVKALTALMHNLNVGFFTSLEATLAVLSKVVEFNSTAKITPSYTDFTTSLATMITPQAEEAADLLRSQAEKHLDSISKRLGIGKSICSMRTANVQGQDLPRPVFALQRDLPGRLGNGLPRHNNDFESIEHIHIMPTSEEILSTHAEYLPMQDPLTWHKQGIDGLLDRHFRLLREDTVGQLRDSARLELEAFQTDGPAHRPGNATLRKHTYRNVLVEIPKFDPYRGLEFVVSFDQPLELRMKSTKQRQDWWRDSKRLEGDALICLISSTQAVVFCSVCYPDDPSKKNKRKEGDAPDPHQNVASNTGNRVRVIARPVEMSEESIFHLLGMFYA
jgi:hypothetical protein